MPRNRRKLAYPRAFSVMASNRTGQCIDALRVIDSDADYRASIGEATRRLLLKGMLLEAAELSYGYREGRPISLTESLIADVRANMGDQPVTGDYEEVLWAVLARMWPELTREIAAIEDPQTIEGKQEIASLLAGSPLTAQGRTLTAEEIRLQALREVAEGRVEAPKLVPPRNVQEAKERARLERAADRLAMNRGVSLDQLLATTPAGQTAGIKVHPPGKEVWQGDEGDGMPEQPSPKMVSRVKRQVPKKDEPPSRGSRS